MVWSAAQKKYANSTRGKEARRKYQQSEKGKASRIAYMVRRKAKLAEIKQETVATVKNKEEAIKIRKEAVSKK